MVLKSGANVLLLCRCPIRKSGTAMALCSYIYTWHFTVFNNKGKKQRLPIDPELGLLSGVVETMGNAGASLGILYSHATGGFRLRTGKINSYFQNLGVASRLNRVNLQKFQFYGKAQVDGR